MKISETNLAQIDTSNYPIIKINIKACNPTNAEADHFIEQLHSVIKSHNGSYICIIDLSKAVWVNKSARDILATGTQYLEDEYASRFKKSFFYLPNIMFWLLFKLLYQIIKPRVTPEWFFNKYKMQTSLEKFVKNMEEDNC